LYVEFEVEEWVGIPPAKVYTGEDLDSIVLDILRDRLEGIYDPGLGVIIAVVDARIVGDGVVLPISGDPNIYFPVRYKVLSFEPLVQEVVKGVVRDVREQGLYVDLGPVDGFVFRGQILDESLEMLPDRRGFRSTETGKVVEIGDVVRARITQVSRPTTSNIRALRIGMTMRQPYLGKEEWFKR
jgi:DNA-directed RNA polymerase subunit E'